MSKLHYNLITLPSVVDEAVINVTTQYWEPRNVRVGDMIAFCNLIAHIRERDQNQNIKIFFDYNVLNDRPHCYQFYNFLLTNTNYISTTPGQLNLPLFDIWPYRFHSGDVDYFTIKNTKIPKQKKICVVPVFDAKYNTFRNWSITSTQAVINRFSEPEFSEHNKFFCSIVNPKELDYKDFVISEDFEQNLSHIMECNIFIGGDTGTSHFAGCLEPGPTHLFYYMNEKYRGQNISADTIVPNGMQMPMHFRSKGKLIFY